MLQNAEYTSIAFYDREVYGHGDHRAVLVGMRPMDAPFSSKMELPLLPPFLPSRLGLCLGTRDALLLFHAGMISARLGPNLQAQQQLDAALRINPHFNVLYADAARKQLAVLQTQLKLTARGQA